MTLIHTCSPHVEAIRAVPEQPVVLNFGSITDHNLGHSIGETAGARHADIAFDDRQLAVRGSHDEGSWVVKRWDSRRPC